MLPLLGSTEESTSSEINTAVTTLLEQKKLLEIEYSKISSSNQAAREKLQQLQARIEQLLEDARKLDVQINEKQAKE